MLHGDGKVLYKDDIGKLRKYHIPYFGCIFNAQGKNRGFDKWQIEEFKRIPIPAKFHNSNTQERWR